MRKKNLNVYTVDFTPVWPTGGALIVAAASVEEAAEIARARIAHTDEIQTPVLVDITKPGVVLYQDGEY